MQVCTRPQSKAPASQRRNDLRPLLRVFRGCDEALRLQPLQPQQSKLHVVAIIGPSSPRCLLWRKYRTKAGMGSLGESEGMIEGCALPVVGAPAVPQRRS